MFIKILRENNEYLHLSKKEIQSFLERFEELEGKEQLKSVIVTANNVSYEIKGSPEFLNNLITEIVRQDPIAESLESALVHLLGESAKENSYKEEIEGLVRTGVSLLKQNAGLARGLNKLAERVSKIDGIKEPVTPASEEPQSTTVGKDENPVKAA